MFPFQPDHPPGPGRSQHPGGPQPLLQDLRLRAVQELGRHRQRDVRAKDKGEETTAGLKA